MKNKTGHLLGMAVAVALGLTATQLKAQQGSFHLLHDAHWGSAVLEPGDYRISTRLGVSGAYMIFLDGPGDHQVVVPSITQIRAPGGTSSLKLQKVNGSYYVTRYQIAATGQTFSFGHPKERNDVRSSDVATTSIPVENAGGTH